MEISEDGTGTTHCEAVVDGNGVEFLKRDGPAALGNATAGETGAPTGYGEGYGSRLCFGEYREQLGLGLRDQNLVGMPLVIRGIFEIIPHGDQTSRITGTMRGRR